MDLNWAEVVYHACVLVWNTSRIEDPEERRASFAEVTRKVVGLDMPGGMWSEMMERTCRRADGLLPEERRIVLDLDVRDLGGGQFYLMVVSAQGAD